MKKIFCLAFSLIIGLFPTFIFADNAVGTTDSAISFDSSPLEDISTDNALMIESRPKTITRVFGSASTSRLLRSPALTAAAPEPFTLTRQDVVNYLTGKEVTFNLPTESFGAVPCATLVGQNTTYFVPSTGNCIEIYPGSGIYLTINIKAGSNGTFDCIPAVYDASASKFFSTTIYGGVAAQRFLYYNSASPNYPVKLTIDSFSYPNDDSTSVYVYAHTTSNTGTEARNVAYRLKLSGETSYSPTYGTFIGNANYSGYIIFYVGQRTIIPDVPDDPIIPDVPEGGMSVSSIMSSAVSIITRLASLLMSEPYIYIVVFMFIISIVYIVKRLL